MKVTLKIEQNGGEYYGWCTINFCEKVELKNPTTIVVDDGIELEFDEVVTIDYVKET